MVATMRLAGALAGLSLGCARAGAGAELGNACGRRQDCLAAEDSGAFLQVALPGDSAAAMPVGEHTSLFEDGVENGFEEGLEQAFEEAFDDGFEDGVVSYAKDPRTPAGGGSALDMPLLMEDHSSSCNTVFMTTMLSTRDDPQRRHQIDADFHYIEKYYRSILSLPGGRAKAIILHDSLPDDVVDNYTTADGAVSFVKVDLSTVDPLLGLNDLRYHFFEQQVKKHPEWDNVFMTDGHDVVVVHNPCVLVEKHPTMLFVGSQRDYMKPKEWFSQLFERMGGKYSEWYKAQPDDTFIKLNAGILGGKRSLVLKALGHMNDVIMDPELGDRKKGNHVTINMAAFNYVFRSHFPDQIMTGPPLHSLWLKFENRTDVYFWHH